MREIKFRIFVKKEGGRYRQGMHDDWGWIFNDNFQEEINPRKTLLQLAFNYPDDFVVMQFTGLHDKNGKEIYEGDVVKFYWGIDPKNPTEMIDVVEFDEGAFFFTSDIGGSAYARRYNEICEVIGNIYENKNLIK